jgi:hypothetical protein
MMMKKILVAAVLLAALGAAGFAQSNIALISGGYFQQKNSYEYKGTPSFSGLPDADFTDTWRSFGIGSTIYAGRDRPFGYYSTSHLIIPIDLVRGSATYDVKDFHFGLDSINGVGKHFVRDNIGFILGGGLHTSYTLFWTYPGVSSESRFNFIDIGAGGGGHLYINVSEDVAIQVGTTWWYDFAQLRWSSESTISDNYYYDGGWGYQVTAGVGLRFD